MRLKPSPAGLSHLLATTLTLGGFALSQDAGQFLVLAFRGSEPPLQLLKQYRPAGVILYPKNLEGDPGGLVRVLRQTNPRLLVMLDQEGGPFYTYRSPGVVRFPSAMSLGAAADPLLAERVGQAIGAQVCSLGAQVNLAPVLDVNVNPRNPIIGLRSFGADPKKVATLGLAFARGLEKAGVIPSAKHFPGHGDTTMDSHLGLPRVDKPLSELEKVELYPFREAVRAGIPLIMTAHILYPALDPENPATLSPAILTGLLREKMGFQGIIVTDDMAMKAIKNHYGAGEAALKAVLAGADLVLLEPDEAATAEVYRTLQAALDQGLISKERYQESQKRLAALEQRLVGPPCPQPDRKAQEALGLEAARRGLTWLKGTLPVPGKGTLVVGPKVNSRYGEEPSLAELAPRFLPGSLSLEVSENPAPAEEQKALAAARKAERVVLGTYHWLSSLPQEQLRLYRALKSLGKPLYVVALGNPDDLTYLVPAPEGYLATYGYRAVQLQAALEALAGAYTPTGRLPIPVGTYPIGFGNGGKL